MIKKRLGNTMQNYTNLFGIPSTCKAPIKEEEFIYLPKCFPSFNLKTYQGCHLVSTGREDEIKTISQCWRKIDYRRRKQDSK